MQNFLLEIFSEELPPLSQNNAAIGLKKIITDELNSSPIDNNIITECYVSPKRLVVNISNIKKFITLEAERKIGPKVGASEKAINGFLKSNKIEKLSSLKKVTKKGDKYYAYDIDDSIFTCVSFNLLLYMNISNKLNSVAYLECCIVQTNHGQIFPWDQSKCITC